MSNVEKSFQKIGAEVIMVDRPARFRGGRFTIDVKTEGKREYFEIFCGPEVELSVNNVDGDHLLLVAKSKEDSREDRKAHFLCGHDERHFFVAAVEPTGTVKDAKDSLKPREVLGNQLETVKKRNTRRNDNWVRQGEWFFIPAPDLEVEELKVLQNEGLRRTVNGRSQGKPHTLEFSYRKGGRPVMTNSGRVMEIAEYERQVAEGKIDGAGWRQERRNPTLYAKGTVRHADHATIYLEGWHRVFMNTERREGWGATSVAFVD